MPTGQKARVRKSLLLTGIGALLGNQVRIYGNLRPDTYRGGDRVELRIMHVESVQERLSDVSEVRATEAEGSAPSPDGRALL